MCSQLVWSPLGDERKECLVVAECVADDAVEDFVDDSVDAVDCLEEFVKAVKFEGFVYFVCFADFVGFVVDIATVAEETTENLPFQTPCHLHPGCCSPSQKEAKNEKTSGKDASTSRSVRGSG